MKVRTLKRVDICISYDDFLREGDYGSNFLFRTAYLCNYISRRVRSLKVIVAGFDRILVEGKLTDNGSAHLYENVAVAPVHFDRQRYDSLKPGEHHEFFIAMLVEGLEKAAKSFSIPLTEICGFIQDFRRGGYKNEWVHKSKLLRGTGLRASLLCAMDSERFTLRLKLERKGATVFDQQILEELPDEICFAHQFKDVVLKGKKVVVTHQFSDIPGKKPLFELNLDELSLAMD